MIIKSFVSGSMKKGLLSAMIHSLVSAGVTHSVTLHSSLNECSVTKWVTLDNCSVTEWVTPGLARMAVISPLQNILTLMSC